MTDAGTTTAELFDAWEYGLSSPAALRPAILLSEALGIGIAAVEAMSVGSCDARLLELRRAAFGDRLEATATCVSCGADVEFELDAATLAAISADSGGEFVVDVGAYTVTCRLPTTGDVRHASTAQDIAEARSLLLEACLSVVDLDGSEVDAASLPSEVLDGVEAAMAERDPHADLRLGVVCPECDRGWDAVLDLGQFVWFEVDRWARRLVVEVATLAIRFGWSETDVLRLSPLRRRAYLELAG
jgi:hypothetical protein